MARCSFCNKNYEDSNNCKDLPIYSKINNKKFDSIKFGKEKDYNAELKRCPCCNVKIGGNHHSNCEIEECPICGRKFNKCDCTY